MALNTSKCSFLTPLHFNGLKETRDCSQSECSKTGHSQSELNAAVRWSVTAS